MIRLILLFALAWAVLLGIGKLRAGILDDAEATRRNLERWEP